MADDRDILVTARHAFAAYRGQSGWRLILTGTEIERLRGLLVAAELHPHPGDEVLHDKLTAEIDGTTQSGWRPIETAPRDGSKMLLFFPGPYPDELEDGVVTGRFLAPGWWLSAIWASSMAHKRPTHWMPLPEPPAGEDRP